MIAIDTNVLLRDLLRDDEAQAERAHRIVEGGERILITDVVLAETTWTLAGRRYRASRANLIDLVNHLLQDFNVCFKDDEVGGLERIAGVSQDGGGLRRRTDLVQG